VLDTTFWSDMAVQIRGHIAYVADSEAQTRRLGIVKANSLLDGRTPPNAQREKGAV
jgi:hypothetical protein